MDKSLIIVLSVLGFYGFVGCLPLYWIYRATARWEKILYSVYLMFFASFLLSMIAGLSGITQQFASNETLDAQARKQISEFMIYIVFSGSMVTFLFGGVGVNVFTTELLKNSAEITTITDERLDRMERKIDKVSSQTSEISSIKKILILLVGLIIVCGLVVLYIYR